jgi:hypothetical protein
MTVHIQVLVCNVILNSSDSDDSADGEFVDRKECRNFCRVEEDTVTGPAVG